MKAKLFFIAVLLIGATTVNAQQIYRLKNRWKTNEYINVEQPTPSSGAIQRGWLSAQWIFEPISGTLFYKIKNKWRNQYLHIETGSLAIGAIQPGWWSAH